MPIIRSKAEQDYENWVNLERDYQNLRETHSNVTRSYYHVQEQLNAAEFWRLEAEYRANEAEARLNRFVTSYYSLCEETAKTPSVVNRFFRFIFGG